MTPEPEEASAAGYTSGGRPVSSSWLDAPPIRIIIDEGMPVLSIGSPGAAQDEEGRRFRALWAGDVRRGKSIAPELMEMLKRGRVAEEDQVEKPVISVGATVVFKDSDPATRREWKVESFDPPSLYAPRFAPWHQPVETCTIRRGSTLKRGVSLHRLELVTEKNDD